MDTEKMLSLPMPDGSRLKLGDCFAVSETYPFFSDEVENYNAQLLWDDRSKSIWWDIYPVSNRVRGCACGGSIEDLALRKLVRRPARSETEILSA